MTRPRGGRTCSGHPRLRFVLGYEACMPATSATSAGMTKERSLFLRTDEALLRLDHLHIGRAFEWWRRRLARASRPADGAEPILQPCRRHKPEQPHLLRAGVHHLVLEPAADQNHCLRGDVIAAAFDVGPAGAAIAEQ